MHAMAVELLHTHTAAACWESSKDALAMAFDPSEQFELAV